MGESYTGTGQHGRCGTRAQGAQVILQGQFVSGAYPREKRGRNAFWIECTRYQTGEPYRLNISSVGGMWNGPGANSANAPLNRFWLATRDIAMLEISKEVSKEASDGRDADLRKVGAHPDHWYPVAWSRDIKPDKTFATSFAGEPIVLVRPKTGDLFALEDRCAHRQVPLSKGVVMDCTVRCCYHGWRYDASGQCVDVPYLGKGKLPNGVRSYPCHEVDGVIFIWPGKMPAAKPPEALGSASDQSYKTRQLGKMVRCHYTFMHENLMDMNHQFLHRRTTGRVTPRYLGRRAAENWMEVDYTFSRPDQKPPIGESLIVGSLRGESHASGDLMTIRTEYPHQSLRFWTSGDVPVLHVWLGYTPVDAEQRHNRTFILLSVQRPKIPGILELAWPLLAWFTNRVFTEDCEIVEMEQSAHDSQGTDWNQEVFPPIQDLRKLLAECGQPIVQAG
jgi:phenylpropionate dioxygenase-like ring-hydroxylating dioxygenase large terminal subunit